MKVTKGSITIMGTPAQLMTLASDFQLLAEYQDEYNNGTGAQAYIDLSDYIIDAVNKKRAISMPTQGGLGRSGGSFPPAVYYPHSGNNIIRRILK